MGGRHPGEIIRREGPCAKTYDLCRKLGRVLHDLHGVEVATEIPGYIFVHSREGARERAGIWVSMLREEGLVDAAFEEKAKMNQELARKRIACGNRGNTPHKFAFSNGSSEEYAAIVRGKTMGESTGHGSAILTNWKEYLKADPLNWLLEPDNPSVRYLALTELLDRPKDDPDVVQARMDIMDSGVVRALLDGQEDGGYWGAPERFYSDRYGGTAWRLMLLAEPGADGSDDQIRRAAEFLLTHSQDPVEGGFSSRYDAPFEAGPHGTPCLTGNMVWSMLRLGYTSDPRIEKAVAWLLRYRRFDDGVPVPPKPAWVGRYKADCWGNHTCMNGVIATLQALAEVPPTHGSKEIEQALAEGAEYLLLHRVYKRSHDLDKPIARHYTQLGFPLFYLNDMLRMLLFLTRIGCRDTRMQEAVDYLVRKQNREGRWKLQKVPKKPMPVEIEAKGQPSKWITLRALTVLKRFHE